MAVRCYPKVKVMEHHFPANEKVVVVPNQSMSLKTVLERFVRREALPIMKEGYYETRFGDLEKLSKADITVKMEKVEEWKKATDAYKARVDKEEKDKADSLRKAEIQAAIDAAKKEWELSNIGGAAPKPAK